ncbi:DUF47 family protein, partial [Candidatus Roizmanbacteria bacterium]|nr:DUF47 family protein [Candidatus Roizmanbacteria bacterium]
MQFFPKTPKFFDLFDALGEKVRTSGVLLSTVKLSSSSRIIVAEKLRKVELDADHICHKITVEADATFIPPIDREDIHALAANLDNIIDHIENLQSHIVLFNVREGNGIFGDYIKVIKEATREVALLVAQLRYGAKQVSDMKKRYRTIHALESQGDELLRKAYTKLFSGRKSPVVIIKWKDLYENLEEIL